MTIDDIKKAVQTDPALAKAIAVWSTTDTAEGKEILTNFAKAEVEKEIKVKTAEIYTNLDNDMFEVLGIRKAHDQKTFDFLKVIAKEYKELKDQKGKINESEEIKKLKADIKKMQDEGSVNEHWRKIYDEAVTKWQEEKKDLDEKIKAKESEYLNAQIEADLRAGINGIKFKDGIDKDILDTLIDAKKREIIKGAKLIDGKVVYHKEDGTPLLNKEYKPITPKEIWSDKLGSLIADGDAGKGGGADPTKIQAGKVEKTGEGDTATIKVVLDKSSYSTKVEFNSKVDEALRKQGIAVGSKEYTGAMDMAYKEYEIDKLPLQ